MNVLQRIHGDIFFESPTPNTQGVNDSEFFADSKFFISSHSLAEDSQQSGLSLSPLPSPGTTTVVFGGEGNDVTTSAVTYQDRFQTRLSRVLKKHVSNTLNGRRQPLRSRSDGSSPSEPLDERSDVSSAAIGDQMNEVPKSILSRSSLSVIWGHIMDTPSSSALSFASKFTRHLLFRSQCLQKRISCQDLSCYPLSYKSESATCSEIKDFTTFLCDLARWVEVMVLSSWDATERAKVLTFLIWIVDQSKASFNFYGAFGLILGLQSPHLARFGFSFFRIFFKSSFVLFWLFCFYSVFFFEFGCC
jgi:hypothetical protein